MAIRRGFSGSESSPSGTRSRTKNLYTKEPLYNVSKTNDKNESEEVGVERPL